MAGSAALGVELDPAYCDVAVRRWQLETGREAVLERDGRSFAAIAGERVLEACRPSSRGQEGEKTIGPLESGVPVPARRIGGR